MQRKLLAAMAALALTVAISGAGTSVVAQDGAGQQPRREGQRMDPAEMRQRMMDNLRERLGATEEEWQALEPKVAAVLEAQQKARAGGMGMAMGMGRGGQGGPGGRGQGGPGAEQDQGELAVAARELRTVLEDENAAGEQIVERLEAFRGARQKAEGELDQARDDLQGLLTQRQEAMLVMMGLLE